MSLPISNYNAGSAAYRTLLVLPLRISTLLVQVPPFPFQRVLHRRGDPLVLHSLLGACKLLPPTVRHVGLLLADPFPPRTFLFLSLLLAQYLPLALSLPRAAPPDYAIPLNVSPSRPPA